MIVRKEIDFEAPLTASQRKMLNDMKHRPTQPDEDCPELTPEQMRKMERKEQPKIQQESN